MDMVYDTLPSHILKERIHFNKFMFNVHQNIHRIKQESKQTNNKRDALSILVDELIKNVHLLFFDEFQVTDIADAMLMQRLFTALFERGSISLTILILKRFCSLLCLLPLRYHFVQHVKPSARRFIQKRTATRAFLAVHRLDL
jgi:hypothetical protein